MYSFSSLSVFSPKVGQSFIPSSVPATFAPSPTPAVVSSGLNDLFDLSTGIGIAPGGYVAPKAGWLPSVKAEDFGDVYTSIWT